MAYRTKTQREEPRRDDWSKLIGGLEDLGIVANNGRAGVQIVGDLSAAIDDLTAQLDRW